MKSNEIISVLKTLNKKSEKTMLGALHKETPFYILISTVLSARNRDDQTIKAVRLLFSKYKTPKDIANANLKNLEPLLRLTGFYRTKSKNIKALSQILLDKYNGKVPESFEELITLPGVGRKTANCVLVYAFNKPAIPVDTHVQRISNRLGWVKTKTPEQTEFALQKLVPKQYWYMINEGIVIHGQTICNPITPICSKCPVIKYCKKVGVKKSY